MRLVTVRLCAWGHARVSTRLQRIRVRLCVLWRYVCAWSKDQPSGLWLCSRPSPRGSGPCGASGPAPAGSGASARVFSNPLGSGMITAIPSGLWLMQRVMVRLCALATRSPTSVSHHGPALCSGDVALVDAACHCPALCLATCQGEHQVAAYQGPALCALAIRLCLE